MLVASSKMAFIGVEFKASEGGGLAIVRSSWLTPRKSKVFWPPYRTQDLYNKALVKGEEPEKNWITYSVTRTYFQCGEGFL